MVANLVVEGEPAATTWFAVQFGPTSFGIFDTFPDDGDRQAHLTGPVAKALRSRGEELFVAPPDIQKLNVLAAKLPKRVSPGVSECKKISCGFD